MTCPICKVGQIRPGEATVTLERGSLTLVIKGVPASVCVNCDEEYLDEQTAATLMKIAEEASRQGTQVEIREYAAA